MQILIRTVALWLMLCGTSLASITPSIDVKTATTVEVGELVVFDALDTTTDNGDIELGKARYEWDFDDGYTYNFHGGVPGQGDDYYYLKNSARSVAHYFMTPGTYDVELTVTAWEDYDPGTGLAAKISTTSSTEMTIGTGSKTCTVETGLSLQATMYGTLMVTGNTSRYMKGTITSYNSGTGELVVDVSSVAGGGETFSAWTISFDTLPAEGPTSTTVQITVTGEAPMAGFELQHAPLNNRSKQYIHAIIPAAHQGGTTQLKVSLIGESAGTTVLVSPKNNLEAEEIFLLDHTNLGIDNWCLQVELLDSEGTRLTGGLWRDKWSKNYSGLPDAYFDENNSLHVDGELFFVQAPFIVNASNQAQYMEDGGHNAFDGAGYDTAYTPATYANYLSTAATNGAYVLGPLTGSFSVQFSGNRWKGNSDTDIMATYVSTNKNSPAVLSWNWHDEPNLGGEQEKVYPPTLAAWKWVCRNQDQQHLYFQSYVGSDWSNYYLTHPVNFDYMKSHVFMGGKKWGQDVLSWDTYPVTQRAYAIQNFTDRGTYAAYLEAIENSQTYNPYTPWFAVPQPCGGMSPYVVTKVGMWHEMWLNVVKGAKGFIYFIKGNKPTVEEWPATVAWDEMLAFSQYIETWKSMILGTPPTNTVSDNSNENLNRVETMLRESGGVSYIWAVRVTEPDPEPELKYQGEEPTTITTTYTCSNTDINGEVGVLELNAGADGYHTVTAVNGVFQDILPENAVRLYTFPAQGGGSQVANTSIRTTGPNLSIKAAGTPMQIRGN